MYLLHLYIFKKLSIYVQNQLNIYSIYEYNIPFNKQLKNLRSGFLQIDGYGTSERNDENPCLQTAEPGNYPKNMPI